MYPLAYFRMSFVIMLFNACSVWAAPGIPNPYYNARYGSALLTNQQRLTGRFYYHQAPFSQDVIFYYYPKGPASRQLIPVARIQTLTVSSRHDTTQRRTFERHQSKLIRRLPDGSQQELTQASFSN